MKINSLFAYNLKPNYNQAFGKTYLNQSKVRMANNKNADVNFVEYNIDDSNDWKQVKSLKTLWGEDSDYTERIVESFKTLRENYDRTTDLQHFYALEDENGDTLAIAKVLDDNKNHDKKEESCVKIGFIQVDPDEEYLSCRRHYFGLGETLVSNIVQKARDEYADSVELMSANEGFWAKNKLFKKVSTKSSAFPIRRLSSNNFDKYINFVEAKKGLDYSA